MSTAVVAYESASLNDRMKYAQTLAAAGDLIPRGLWNSASNVNGVLVPAAPSPGKVLLVMETGAMLGLMPAAALQSIDVVEGKATLSARLMGALIRKAGHKLEVVKTGSIPGGDYSVTVTGTRADDGSVFTSTWDIPRAIRAGLVQSYEPNAQGVFEVRARSDKGGIKPWEAYAETMPVWRGMSEVGREGFADVLFGLYSTEEITDGGIPVADPDPEPSEDWPALIAAATTRAELDDIKDRIAAKDEGTDKLRAAWLARAGVLSREENTEDADVVPDDPETPSDGEVAYPSAPLPSPSEGLTEEEFEAAEAARFDAAMDAGEVDRD
ncbi:hypothetical protein ACTJJ4_07430 [Microbacterium sp. 22195]|uniref:hypothetical protein n=1 Tax=Microbacterium sp. 22195 TaxID=3453891 RepID=UPI003F8646A1